MKRSGFTLIELIFVIVIIGVLAAVAVPKFQNLKQSADSANVIKVAHDTFNSLPSAFVNAIDLEDGNKSAIKLADIVAVTGKNWTVSNSAGDGQTAKYMDNNESAHTVIELTFNPDDRNATMDVNCSKFIDETTQTKCIGLMGAAEKSEVVKF